MASTTDDGFHEIQLNGKQLVFLFMAVTVVSVVIFLCGVLVGQGVRAGTEVQASEVAPAADPVVAEPTGSAPTAADAAGPAPQERLTYPETLGDRDSKPAPLSEAAPSRTPSARSESADLPKPEPAAARTPPAPAAAPSATPAPAAPAPAAPAPSSVAGEPGGRGYAIQVAALRERAEAEAMVRRLTGKGYAAYLLAPAAGAPSMYRVRIGKFEAQREAQRVAGRLQKEEKFKPWIVR